MKVDDLTEPERKIWQAAATGTVVDLRVGDSAIDSPEKGTAWGPERTVRAEVIADLVLGDSKAAAVPVRGVRLQGARITGELNLEASTLLCPLALLDCSFASPINLNEATALSVRLSGSHVPAVHARQLLTRGDFRLDDGFSVSDGVDLAGAHIGGELKCTDGHFSNPEGLALSADGITVDQDLNCDAEFTATGGVSLIGAHIGGHFGCRGGKFSNLDGLALSANGLTVNQNVYFDGEFSATGEVRLAGAHVGGLLNCTGGHFFKPGGRVFNADRLTVDQYIWFKNGFSATGEVRLLGAHIRGQLNCTGGQFSNPGGYALTADGLSVDSDLFFEDNFSSTGEVRLVGAHIGGQFGCSGGQFSNLDPKGFALRADGLTVDGSMFCGEGFSASGEVSLSGAHIGGQLDCTGGQFSNPNGPALTAVVLTIDQGMLCNQRFSARGEVLLVGAHIGVELSCTGGQFYNPNGSALTADGLVVDGDMSWGKGFVATGKVSLSGAHISGDLYCTGGQFSNPDGDALTAYAISVDGNMFCGEGFVATGEVGLLGAHIAGVLICAGGQFSNPDGSALYADRLVVDRDMSCGKGFVATGKVSLWGAQISGDLYCTGGQFSNPDGLALDLERATVNGSLLMQSAVLEGLLDLTATKTSHYQDDTASWPKALRLDGFVYDAIEGATVKERLQWLHRNAKGYSPQLYDQLAAVYRLAGEDDNTRRVLIAKQRRRFAQRNVVWKLGGYLLDFLVGYGYRTWLAALWLIGFLILGTWLFGSVYQSELTPANKPDVQPPFQPFFYTLDLLLPVVSLHVRDAWIAHDAAQAWSVIFIIVGWILATAVVLSLTGLLKRD